MPTFTLEDIDPVDRPDLTYHGVSYPAQLPDDFGLDVEAKLNRLLKQIETWEKRPNNVKKAETLEDMACQIIQLYFPTLPLEIIKTIPFLKKQEIMEWWGENCYPLGLRRLREMMQKRRISQVAS